MFSEDPVSVRNAARCMVKEIHFMWSIRMVIHCIQATTDSHIHKLRQAKLTHVTETCSLLPLWY